MGREKIKKRTYEKWTDEEDTNLRQLVEIHDAKNWATIAENVPGRSSKQCRERWLNHLSPELKLESWTDEEDATLIQEYGKIGPKLAQIANLFPGRTAAQVRNRLRKKTQQDTDLISGEDLDIFRRFLFSMSNIDSSSDIPTTHIIASSSEIIPPTPKEQGSSAVSNNIIIPLSGFTPPTFNLHPIATATNSVLGEGEQNTHPQRSFLSSLTESISDTERRDSNRRYLP
jgi:hypothetical protein